MATSPSCPKCRRITTVEPDGRLDYWYCTDPGCDLVFEFHRGDEPDQPRERADLQ